MENSNIICGRNPVLEALRSGREIDRLLVAHGTGGGSVTAIIAKCRAKGILIKEISPQKLDYYCGGNVCVAGVRYSGGYGCAGGNARRKALFNNLR